MMAKKEKKISTDEEKYSATQICNILRFSGTDRDYVMKRHRDKCISYLQWKLIFKKEGLTL